MNLKNILFITSPILLLSSCFPDGNNLNSLGTGGGLAKPILVNLATSAGIKDSAKLEKNIAGPIKNKEIMEETASKIKRGFPLSPDVQTKGKNAYITANNTLNSLKSSIKSDIENGSKASSVSTKKHADKFSTDVASLKQVYAEASGRQDKSAALIGAYGLLEGGFNIWSSYNETKKKVLLENVDSKLHVKSWDDIQ